MMGIRSAFVTVCAVSLSMVAGPGEAGAQLPEPGVREAPEGWEILVRPRVGFFLPSWNYADGQALPRRPTFGLELGIRREDSWYGGRMLFERAFAWSAQSIPGRSLGDGSPRPEHFETVVADLMVYLPGAEGTRPYLFLGGGAKAINYSADVGISPYSFSGAQRAATAHFGVGMELSAGGAGIVLEFGDFYGGKGGRVPFASEVLAGHPAEDPVELGRLHDLHATFMIQLPSVGDVIESVRKRKGRKAR